MNTTTTGYYSRIRYFTSPSERPGEVNNFIGDNNINAWQCHGVIGGGQNNCIGPATDHSSIFSGHNNIVTGSCSSILGGSGNNDAGFNYVGIFGQNVAGVMNNAFHAEELVLQNIPVDVVPGGGAVFAALPNGALYTIAAAGGPFLSRPIYVK